MTDLSMPSTMATTDLVTTPMMTHQSTSDDDSSISSEEEIDEFGFPQMLNVRFFSVNRALTPPQLGDDESDGMEEAQDSGEVEDDEKAAAGAAGAESGGGGDDVASDAGDEEEPLPPRPPPPPSALMTFCKEARMQLPRHILRSSKFFRTRFEKQWRGESAVDIEVPSPALLDSFVVAIHSETFGGGGGRRIKTIIDSSNQFEMYQAANMLGLPSLIARTEKHLRDSLAVSTLVRSLKLGMRFRRRPLMRACYNWVKRHGESIVDKSSIDSATEAAASALALLGDNLAMGVEGGAALLQIVYDPVARKLAHGDFSVPIDLFEESIDAEHICKQRYFCPGLHTSLRPRDGDAYSAKLGKGFAGTTKTYLQRRRIGGADDAAVFVVYLEATGKPLIAARLMPPGNVIHISSTADDFTTFGETHLATVACNFLGTQFSIVDYGLPAGLVTANALPSARGEEHGLISYTTNILGRVPNAMQIVVPSRTADCAAETPVAEIPAEVRSRQACRATRPTLQQWSNKADYGPDTCLLLRTRQPKWNESLEAWTMDFKGRVKKASKKNFQLISQTRMDDGTPDEDNVLMLFGKVSRDRFSLDFAPPLSVVQALAIALTTFTDKLAVT